MGDGGFYDGWQSAETPTGYNNAEQKMYARSGINHHLDNNECYVGDGGYYDGWQLAETPTGYNNAKQKMYALARACHEMVSIHFKCFECLSNTYRHPLHWHGTMFHATAYITKLSIMDEQPLFQVDYDKCQSSQA